MMVKDKIAVKGCEVAKWRLEADRNKSLKNGIGKT